MASFVIEGGHRLKGVIEPQGAKNEALEVIAATLLSAEPVRLTNIPDILDVNNLIRLIADMGVSVTKNGAGDYTFCADHVDLNYLHSEEFLQRCTQLRGSVLLMGPLLARFGRASMAKPGGDKIGRRRLDTHFLGFRHLGADFVFDEKAGVFTIEAKALRGTYMLLDEASITGTANIIMAAVLAQGTTTIYNAACEPYIQQLCKLLNKMGAIPDTFRRLGVRIERQGDDLFIPAQPHYASETFIDGSFLTMADAPWPGLTPDLLSVLIVVATQAKGTVLFHQKMFESRLFFVDKLIDMGAQIILCDPHRAVVVGHNHALKLQARRMTSPDIRAGIALLIAALSAEGTSIIDNIEQIDRGYERIEERLGALGAVIKRID